MTNAIGLVHAPLHNVQTDFLSMARPFADNAVMELPFARPGREARRGKPLPLTGLGIETAAR